MPPSDRDHFHVTPRRPVSLLRGGGTPPPCAVCRERDAACFGGRPGVPEPCYRCGACCDHAAPGGWCRMIFTSAATGTA